MGVEVGGDGTDASGDGTRHGEGHTRPRTTAAPDGVRHVQTVVVCVKWGTGEKGVG